MASPNVIEVKDDPQFTTELANAGTKLVVVDFYATWCGPCRRIAPAFQSLSAKYRNVVFLKVDVDVCKDTATDQGVTAMPTFLFFKNKVLINESVRGADPVGLEDAIKRLMGGEENGAEEEASPVKGHNDLSGFINNSGCECLNEADEHPLAHALTSKGGYLESDCDEQLIITIQFNQAIKLHSLKINGPEENGPKTVKIFQNLPRSLDFDSAESNEPTQTLVLTAEDIKDGAVIPVRFVKFQNVMNITDLRDTLLTKMAVSAMLNYGGICRLQTHPVLQMLFVKDNLGGTETTQIDQLGFVGTAVNTTNMADFKRVAGKKGESH